MNRFDAVIILWLRIQVAVRMNMAVMLNIEHFNRLDTEYKVAFGSSHVFDCYQIYFNVSCAYRISITSCLFYFPTYLLYFYNCVHMLSTCEC